MIYFRILISCYVIGILIPEVLRNYIIKNLQFTSHHAHHAIKLNPYEKKKKHFFHIDGH